MPYSLTSWHLLDRQLDQGVEGIIDVYRKYGKEFVTVRVEPMVVDTSWSCQIIVQMPVTGTDAIKLDSSVGLC